MARSQIGNINDIGGYSGGESSVDTTSQDTFASPFTTGSKASFDLGVQLLEAGNVGAALGLLTGPESSVEAEKRKTSKEDAERIVSGLEAAYFLGPNGPLAYGGGEGYEGRLSGAKENFDAVAKGGDYNPYLSNYLKYRNSIKPTLARAAGDVGNLSASEQTQAVQQVPTGANSISESILYFKWLRQRLGLQQRNWEQVLPAMGKTQALKGDRSVVQLDYTPLQGLQVPDKLPKFNSEEGFDADQSGNLVGTDISKLSLPQRVAGTTEQTLPLNLPGGKAYGELGAIAGRFTGLPPGLRTLLGSSIGQTLENYSEKGVPLTREEGNRQLGLDEGTSALQALLPGNQLKAAGSLIGSPLKFGTPSNAAALDLLLSPHEVIGGLRSLRASTLGNIPGKEIINPLAKQVGAKATASTLNAANEFVEGAKDVYKGGTSVSNALSKRELLGKIVRTAKGDVKTVAGAEFGDIERGILSAAIKRRSLLIGSLDKIDELLYGGNRILQGIQKIAFPAAISAGTYMGLNRATGQQ